MTRKPNASIAAAGSVLVTLSVLCSPSTVLAQEDSASPSERQMIEALYIPLADHYAGIVAFEKYRNEMKKADYRINRMPSWPMLRAEFLSKNADLAYIISPMAMDMFAKSPTFRWVSLLHRDGNALAINDLLNERVGLPFDRAHRRPDEKVADAFVATSDETGRVSECGVPSLQSTHTVILYKYLKDHGRTLSLGGTDGDVIAIPVAPPKSPQFIKLADARGVPASFEQSLPWADVVETGHFGHVAWYSKDVLPWPEGHVECIAIAQDATILDKSEALAEVIHYLHKAGQDIEEAREEGGAALDEIADMIRRHIPEHTPDAIRQSLRLDLDVINYRHLNVDEGGLEQVMDLAVEGGILTQPIDITAFANHDYSTRITLQRSRPVEAEVQAAPIADPDNEEHGTATASSAQAEPEGRDWWHGWWVILGAFLSGLAIAWFGRRSRERRGDAPEIRSLFAGGRLGRTLALWFLVLSLAPLLVVTFLSYRTAQQSLTQDAEVLLGTITHLKATQLRVHFESVMVDLDSDARDPANVAFLAELSDAFAQSDEALSRFINTPGYEKQIAKRGAALHEKRRTHGFYDVLLVDREGNVLFSVAREANLGTNLFADDGSTNHLADACRRALSTGRSVFSDFDRYAPSGDAYAGFAVAPLIGDDARQVGVLAFQINHADVDALTSEIGEWNESAYAYLLGPDMLLRTNLPDGAGDPTEGLVAPSLAEPWSRYMSEMTGEDEVSGTEEYPGHTGALVLGAREHLDVGGVGYLLVAEIPKDQALSAASGLLYRVILLLVATGVLVLLAGFGLARRIVSPLLHAAGAARRVAEGDLGATVEVKARNEIGDLSRAINQMTQNLRVAADDNERSRWIRNGHNEILEAMRGSQELPELCDNVVSTLSRILGAQVGLLYVVDQYDHCRLRGTFAANGASGAVAEFGPGEGLVGQVARDRMPLMLTDIPEDFVRVAAGVGAATPRALLVQPLESAGQIRGVLEIASLGPLPASKAELIPVVSENVAIGLATVQDQQQVRDLLGETQRQAHELQAQQEELKVSNEELEEQTQQLQESEARLQAQQEEMAVTNEELAERNEQLKGQKRRIEDAGRELERKADELALASKYKSEFLANMSHELRTPLNSLLLLAKWLSDNKEGNLTDEQIESAEVIYGSGSDLLNLINEILDLARIESGRLQTQIREVTVEDLAAAARKVLGPMARQKELDFEVEIAADLPAAVSTDPARLQQIVKNLGSNAIKFTERGTVVVRFHRAPPDVDLASEGLEAEGTFAVSVKDTGIGIASDQQNVVFEAFQQADGGTSREHGGTGLGLSISRELAHLLGGEIQLESVPGEGSEFTLYLPLDGPTTEARTADRPAPPLTRSVPSTPAPRAPTAAPPPLKDDRDTLEDNDSIILVIEDDLQFAKMLLNVCRERGFRCLIAATGEDGLELAARHVPDGILLDLGLPGIDGWTTLGMLKEDTTTRHIPVHVISAETQTTETRRRGAIGHLTKPVDTHGLAEALDLLERTVSELPRKVLLVEDDETARRHIRQVIGNGDLVLEEVVSGEEALEAMQGTEYGCLILDLGLPDMGGDQLLTRATEQGIDLPPVVVHTARELTEDEERRLMEHAESIVIKDVRSQERLLDEVSLFLHRKIARLPEKKKQIIVALHETDDLLAGKTVLVAEDDMRTAFAMSRLLAERGMLPVKAADGRQALDVLERTPQVDLVLMDIMMPVFDGYETIKRIRVQERFRSLPIIALTAKAMPEDRQRCIDAGANDYLPKPVNTERLLSMMRVWLYR